MNKPRLRFIAVTALLLGLLTPTTYGQSAKRVVVEQRNGDITVQSNGDVRIVETWLVRFTGGPYRRAFRAIPLNRVSDITDWGVSENGAAYQQSDDSAPKTFSVTTNDNGERMISWHFPPTSDATRAFQLSYTLYGALRIYAAGDEFFWKFIEADRQYTINASTVTVNLPQPVEPSQLTGSTYRNGREQQNEATIQNAQQLLFDGVSFPGGTEWEIRARWPHGVVSAQTAPWQQREDGLMRQTATPEQVVAATPSPRAPTAAPTSEPTMTPAPLTTTAEPGHAPAGSLPPTASSSEPFGGRWLAALLGASLLLIGLSFGALLLVVIRRRR